jgi:hypothetical protein
MVFGELYRGFERVLRLVRSRSAAEEMTAAVDDEHRDCLAPSGSRRTRVDRRVPAAELGVPVADAGLMFALRRSARARGVLPYLCRRLPEFPDQRAAPSDQFREFPNSRR